MDGDLLTIGNDCWCYVKVEMTFDQPISFLEAELFNFEKNAFHAKENTRPYRTTRSGGHRQDSIVGGTGILICLKLIVHPKSKQRATTHYGTCALRP